MSLLDIANQQTCLLIYLVSDQLMVNKYQNFLNTEIGYVNNNIPPNKRKKDPSLFHYFDVILKF